MFRTFRKFRLFRDLGYGGRGRKYAYGGVRLHEPLPPLEIWPGQAQALAWVRKAAQAALPVAERINRSRGTLGGCSFVLRRAWREENASNGEIERAGVARPGVEVAPCGSNRRMAERGLDQVNGGAAVQSM